MNLQELKDNLVSNLYGDEKSGIDRYMLYKQKIKDTEPTVDLSEILNNPLNKKNIYVDYHIQQNKLFFSQIYDAYDEIIVDYIFFELTNNKIIHDIFQDFFSSKEDLLNDGWPDKYILFDEDLFNQFMNPPNKPEFLNWSDSNPWEVKE